MKSPSFDAASAGNEKSRRGVGQGGFDCEIATTP
jgi:hypothetical protein